MPVLRIIGILPISHSKILKPVSQQINSVRQVGTFSYYMTKKYITSFLRPMFELFCREMGHLATLPERFKPITTVYFTLFNGFKNV